MSPDRDSSPENAPRSGESSATGPVKGRASGRKRKRRWFVVLFVLLALIALTPNLIGWTGLHQPLVDYAAADLKGKVRIGSLSCGWMQPVVLRDIEVIDEQGQQLLTIESVTSKRQLLQLLTRSDFGTFDIVSPHVQLLLRPDGSNLEDALANYLVPSDDESTTLPDLQINVQQGTAQVTSISTTQNWQIDPFQGAIRLGGTEAAVLIDLNAQIASQRVNDLGQPETTPPGSVKLAAQIDAGQTQLLLESADVSIESDEAPLSILGPALERVIGKTEVNGVASGKLEAFYNGPEQSITVNIEKLAGSQLAMASETLLGPDLLWIQTLDAQGKLQLTPDVIAADSFAVDSELGNVRASGTLDTHQLTRLTQQIRLLDTPFQLDGKLDLARASKLLPSTLKLHRDLQVKSGTLTFHINTRAEGNDRRLVFNVDTANVNAQRGSKQIMWSKPLRLVGTLSQRNGELGIEQLSCESDFLNVSGEGNFRAASFQASGDLNVLTERIAEFVDLEGTELAGVFQGEFGWQVTGESAASPAAPFDNLPLQLGGKFTIKQPRIKIPGTPIWDPGEITIQLSAHGKSTSVNLPPGDDGTAPTSSVGLRIDQGGFELHLGSERAVAALTEPIQDLFTQSRWHAQAQVTGRLERWLEHIDHFVDLGDFRAAGDMNLVSTIVASPESIRLNEASYQVQDFGFAGYGMKISEPTVRGEGGAIVDVSAAAIQFSDLTLISNSVSARGRNFRIAVPNNVELSGDVAFRANMNRVADWFELSPDPESLFWFGDGEGTVRFTPDSRGLAMQIDAEIKDFVAARQTDVVQQNASGPILQAGQAKRQWSPIWQEPRFGLNGQIIVAHDYDQITFVDAAIESAGLSGTIDGTLSDLAQTMTVDVEGEYRPDWSRINGLLAEFTYQTIQVQGSQPQHFSIQGPLFAATENPSSSILAQPTGMVPTNLSGTAGFAWDSGTLLGLKMGGGELNLDLSQGIARVNTDGIPFSDGKIAFAPEIDLRTPQPMLKMGWTRVVDNVALTPETARMWLRYVAPLAADATSAQGQFTIDVGEAAVPLLDPYQTQARGAVRMSNVVVGAGPLAEQLIGTIQQVRKLLKPDASDRDLNTWLRISEQTIPVAVRDGRVYHDQLNLTHKDLVIRTRGSVGLTGQQTLDMVAEIPIADDWIAGKDYLSSLKGQSITIPIGGTISQPKLDKSGVEQLTRTLAQQAARGAIDQAIEKKVSPKLDELQQRFNDKVNQQFNKIQQDFNKKLGIGPSDGSSPTSNNPLIPGLLRGPAEKTTDQPAAEPGQELLRGIGDLFKK